MTNLVCKVRTAIALGVPNISRVIAYRLGGKLGLNPVRRLQAQAPQGIFFHATQRNRLVVTAPPVSAWSNSANLFSYREYSVSDEPPDWMANPFTGQRVLAPERQWWKIADFDPAVGDIKLIWELSRMDWALALGQRAHLGDQNSLSKLNNWLNDWCKVNPPFKGPNWKCGQEASIRVMHLAMTALILDQAKNSQSSLLELIELHLRRIAPTLQYAIAQDNNHGTSEAAALFIGGSWLSKLGIAKGEDWAKIGRKWLENRAHRLIGQHGTFSQYSLNYHRVMLDTFSMVEVWRKHFDLTAFSPTWHSSILSATQWLRHMINPINGDGPNVGANDGARLLQLSDTAYRDYRPSVQLAMALFAKQRAYAQTGPWDYAAHWLSIDIPLNLAPTPVSYVADDGGFAMLRRGAAMAVLRYPRFQFRPSQADALHLDLWLGADNLLRDSGTYSYNTDPKWLNYFGGTISHNTVQFDDRDQMPRISRFLFGDWLKTERFTPLIEDAQSTHVAAGYCNRRSANHYRTVTVEDAALKVIDEVQGFANHAVLRWRLMPGAWQLVQTSKGYFLKLNDRQNIVLSVIANVPITRCELVQGWESRHYFEKSEVPVLELEINQPGILTTELNWLI